MYINQVHQVHHLILINNFGKNIYKLKQSSFKHNILLLLLLSSYAIMLVINYNHISLLQVQLLL